MTNKNLDINALARRAVYKQLEECIIENPSNPGIVKYINNFTDEIVAKTILENFPDAKVTASSVASLRLRAWGQLEKPLTLEQQLELLKKENEELKAKLSKQEYREQFPPSNIDNTMKATPFEKYVDSVKVTDVIKDVFINSPKGIFE